MDSLPQDLRFALQMLRRSPGFASVAVLGHGLWVRRFGADPAVMGRSIVLDGQAVTVVGVMPRGFRFPSEDASDLWMPTVLDPADAGDYSTGYLTLVGRLRPGVTSAPATAALAASYLPARRATRVDPMAAMRAD